MVLFLGNPVCLTCTRIGEIFASFKKIGVGKQDCYRDVRFSTESRNMAVSRMRNKKICTIDMQITYKVTLISSDHPTSSVIVNLAMGRYHVPHNVFLGQLSLASLRGR